MEVQDFEWRNFTFQAFQDMFLYHQDQYHQEMSFQMHGHFHHFLLHLGFCQFCLWVFIVEANLWSCEIKSEEILHFSHFRISFCIIKRRVFSCIGVCIIFFFLRDFYSSVCWVFTSEDNLWSCGIKSEEILHFRICFFIHQEKSFQLRCHFHYFWGKFLFKLLWAFHPRC